MNCLDKNMKIKYFLLNLFYLLFIFQILSVHTAVKPNIESDLKKENLLGLVEKVQIFSNTKFTLEFGNWIESPKILNSIKTFDVNGNISEFIEYDFDGHVTNKRIFDYKYNDFGNILTKIEYYEDGSIKDKHVYEYNEIKCLTSETLYDGQGSFLSRKVWKYDLDGNLLEEAELDQNGDSVFGRILYLYDDNGHQTEKRIIENDEIIGRRDINSYAYDVEDHILEIISTNLTWYGYWWKYKYDTNNNLIEHTQLGQGIITQYFYDVKGHIIEEKHYDRDGIVTIYRIYTYDEYGNVVDDIQYDKNGNIEFERPWNYIYSDNGLVLEKSRIYEIESGITGIGFKYEYDSNNRLFKEIQGGYLQNGIWEYTGDYARQYEYDELGRLQHIIYIYNGMQKSKTEYKYNENGKLYELIIYEENFTAHTFYYYNDNGHVIEEIHTRDNYDGSRLFYNYVYNDDKITEKYLYTAKGDIVTKYEYTGSTVSKIIRKYYKEDNKTVDRIETNYFDRDDNLTEITLLFVDQNILNRTVYKYHTNGILEQSVEYDYDGNERQILRYDDKDNEIENIIYDNEGNIAQKNAIDYDYDSYGNWIKKTHKIWVTKFGESYYEPEYAETRTITYKTTDVLDFVLY